MAWALKFDGVDDFAAFAKVSKVGDFKIEALGVEFLSTPTGSDFETIIGSDNFTDFLAYRASSNGWYWRNNNVNTVFPNTTVPLPVGQFDLTLERIGSTATLTVNGSSDSASSNGANPFRVAAIGMINSSSPSAAHGGNIRIQQLKFYDTTLSLHLDADSSSHDPGTPVLSDIVGTNHATGSNMPTDGSAWVNVAAGTSIDVNATLGTINYTSQHATVQLTGDIDINPTLGTIAYNSHSATIQLSGDIDVNSTLGTISYTSNNTQVQLTGEINATATLGQINYTSQSTTVNLDGGIAANATLGQINYTNQPTTVTLQGVIQANATLGAIVYNSNNSIVQIGEGQKITIVTAGFKPDSITSQFKPDSITATFRTN